MATIVKRTGDEFAMVEGDVITPITKFVDDGVTLVLPKNEANRTYLKISVFEKHQVNNELELTYKPTITLGARGSRKPLTDYMSKEELKTYNDIIARAEAARKADVPKPLTEIEKLQRSIERGQAKLAELQAKAGE